MFDVGLPTAGLLVAIAFVSGIGITTIGPGGVFVTIALYSFTSISAGEVAGTAHATFIATGVVGTLTYVHSGEMSSEESRIVAVILSATSVVGALCGAYVNSHVSRSGFGFLLGGAMIAVGGTILYREWGEFNSPYAVDVTTQTGRTVVGVLGFVLGGCSGLLGVGGPVLAVPALVLFGVPMLLAVAVAQMQSIFIATFATAGYVLQGNVSWPLATIVGVPLIAGTVVGWKVAHLVNPARLKAGLGVTLVAIGPYLALS